MKTWSYTIMGNSEATRYWFIFSDYIWSYLTDTEIKTLRSIPNKRIESIIEEHYEGLVRLLIEQKSRLAYQVLGVFLMKFGAKMTNALKELILNHSHWEDEVDQLFNERDRAERYYYLNDFRDKINAYKEGIKTIIFNETPNRVVERLRQQGIIATNYPFVVTPSRASINYDIK